MDGCVRLDISRFLSFLLLFTLFSLFLRFRAGLRSDYAGFVGGVLRCVRMLFLRCPEAVLEVSGGLILVVGGQILVVGGQILVVGWSILVVGWSILVVGCRDLVVGWRDLVVGGWHRRVKGWPRRSKGGLNVVQARPQRRQLGHNGDNSATTATILPKERAKVRNSAAL